MEMKEYMRSKRWGVFNHYLPWPKQGTPRAEAAKQWNDTVDSFDTEKLAKTLHEMGAGYYFITLMHGAEYMPVPNKAYEKITKMPESTLCSKRDLVLDLYESLKKYDIDLCLYYNALSPFNNSYSADCRENIFGKKVEVTQIGTFQNVDAKEFAAKWSEPIRELSLRYGDKIKMWWLDSCYDYAGYTEELLRTYYDAFKAGNPDVLVGYNNGELIDMGPMSEEVKAILDRFENVPLIKRPSKTIIKRCSFEELTCGENNDFDYLPDRGDFDGALTHLLIPIGADENGNTWGCPGTKHSNEFFKDYVKKVNSVGGIITFDIGVKPDGSFYDEQVEALLGI